jgi:hypothetical protein
MILMINLMNMIEKQIHDGKVNQRNHPNHTNQGSDILGIDSLF